MANLENLPAYLKKYIKEQNYAKYTSEDQATWRYIMRQSRAFYKDHAVGIYLKGLEQTGIPIDHIPRIEDMDERMSQFGWGAIGICGFIPSSVFLDLLARKIMPIATDMRTLDHIGYTPAPDIVHEAAGHAPIVADPVYRRFLERYSQLAYHSLISKEDMYLYEAIRYLSDIKENPDSKAAEIKKAEDNLKIVGSSMTFLSEASKIARFAWWTIEYGLVGHLKSPKIYGAGLLSSVSEGKSCLSDKVKKIPLTIDCIHQTYDITEPQPQLFVAKSLEYLPIILEDLENSFAFKKGGRFGLEEMKKADTLNSILFDNHSSISGELDFYEVDDNQKISFIKLAGPSQICFKEKELPGQGQKQHPTGFSSPVGRWKTLPDTRPRHINRDQLREMGIAVSKDAELEFCSGFKVKGHIKSISYKENMLMTITWTNCTVQKGEKNYFQPEWGEFDMLIVEKVRSVFAGPADRDAFGDYYVGDASTAPGRTSGFSDTEKQTFSFFDKLKKIRQREKSTAEDLESLAESLMQSDAGNWLVALEILEVAKQKFSFDIKNTAWLKNISNQLLENSSNCSEETHILIEQGLQISNQKD